MNKIKLPQGWNEVSCYQYLDIVNLDIDMTFFIKQLHILSILSNIEHDDSIWEDMYVEELTEMINDLKWINKSPSNNFKKQIENFTCIDLNKLTVGEFIDIDYFIKENQFENLPKICSVLYRQTKLGEWGETIFEPYDIIELENRSEFFFNLPITSIYGVLDYFIQFRNMIVNSFPNLFNPIINEEDLDEEDLDDPEVIKERQKEKNHEVWAWDGILYDLTNGDITKENTIFNLPLIFVLRKLTHRKLFNS